MGPLKQTKILMRRTWVSEWEGRFFRLRGVKSAVTNKRQILQIREEERNKWTPPIALVQWEDVINQSPIAVSLFLWRREKQIMPCMKWREMEIFFNLLRLSRSMQFERLAMMIFKISVGMENNSAEFAIRSHQMFP